MVTEETRADGWQNVLLGHGTRHDPSESTRMAPDHQLGRDQLESIYRADGIGRRIVDLPAEEMTRRWVEVKGQRAEEMEALLDRIDARQAFNRALRWSGLYGGAVVLLLVNDGAASVEEKLWEGNTRDIVGLRVYDRFQVSWTTGDLNTNPASHLYGTAEYMQIQPLQGTPFRAHRSRLLVFDGEDIPDRMRQANQGWGDSRLQPVFRALGRYGEGLSGTSSIIRDFILPVMTMKNLADLIASGREDEVRKRLQILGVSRSMLNIMLLDADNEGYEKKASTVAGIDKLLEELKHNLSACAGIPSTKLFGRAPAGLNSTGESDQRNWYDSMAGEQQDKMLPYLRELVRIADLTMGGTPADRDIVARPLWQPSEQELAATRKTNVEAATMALDYGLVDQATAEGWVGAGE